MCGAPDLSPLSERTCGFDSPRRSEARDEFLAQSESNAVVVLE